MSLTLLNVAIWAHEPFLLLRVPHSSSYFRIDPADQLTCKYADDFASGVSRGAVKSARG